MGNDWRSENSFSGQTRIYHAACGAPINGPRQKQQQQQPHLCAHVMANSGVRWGGRWMRSHDQQHHPSSSSSFFLWLALLLSLSVEPSERAQRMAGRASKILEIGCAEKRLEIDPPLITVCLKYLSARAPFKHTVSQGFFFSTSPCRFSNHHSNQPPLIFSLWTRFHISSYPSSWLKKIKDLEPSWPVITVDGRVAFLFAIFRNKIYMLDQCGFTNSPLKPNRRRGPKKIKHHFAGQQFWLSY